MCARDELGFEFISKVGLSEDPEGGRIDWER